MEIERITAAAQRQHLLKCGLQMCERPLIAPFNAEGAYTERINCEAKHRTNPLV
jgi:hypothetical protein